MPSSLKTTRKFDGKTFKYHSRSYKKSEIEKSKNLLKRKGFNARITRRLENRFGVMNIKYEIWKRRKS